MNTAAKKKIKRDLYAKIYLMAGVMALVLMIPITLLTIKNGTFRYLNFAAGECTFQISPGQSIQSALDAVRPGETICLSPGVYKETLTTKRAGTAGSPITIRGNETAKIPASRNKTVLHPGSLCSNTEFTYCRNIQIDHSYYRIEGFTIDGQEALRGTTYPTNASQAIAFKSNNKSKIKDGRNIYIGSSETSKDITGVVITNMYIRGGGGECVRMRNNAFGNEVSNSVIEWCGMFAKPKDGFDYHNGEGVYIGTSPKSTTQPMYENDQSRNNIVKNNIIHTFGSECFNVKENAHSNSLVANECAYNLEPESLLGSNIELRGHNNSIEGNTIFSSAGWNIKLKSDETQYDKGGNSIFNNRLSQASGPNVYNVQRSVGKICGNTIDGSLSGVDQATFTKACEGAVPTSTPTVTPPGAATPTATPAQPTITPISTAVPAGRLVFALAGDWDDKFPGATTNTLTAAKNAQADLIGFIGDLSYAGLDTNEAAGRATATTWCSKVKPILGTTATAFTPGDHDSWLQDGHVGVYDSTSCLNRPTTSAKVTNLTGNYPWLYYFDMTDGGVTVRVVGSAGDASGDLVAAHPSASAYMEGYQVGGPSYLFLSQAFTDAKNKNYWTVYLNHEPCIDAGKDNPGQWCYDVVDLMSDTGVDVMSTGSSHNAWLSKQMSKGPDCPKIMINGKGALNPKCAKDATNNAFIEGQGWVNAHAGTAGKDGSSSYDCLTGPDVPLLVSGTCGYNKSDGAVFLTITADAINGEFRKNAGGLLYKFSITRSGVVVPTTGVTTQPRPTVPGCPMRNKGDATCDSVINFADYVCWKSEFVDKVKPASCVTSDFDGVAGVTILDFTIWKATFAP